MKHRQLLLEDDTMMTAESSEQFQRLAKEVGRVCGRRKKEVNMAYSKVMVVGKERTAYQAEIERND